VKLNIVHQVLSQEQLTQVRARLEAASWIDGRATAGLEAARIKRNLQLELGSPLHKELSELVKKALNASDTFKQLSLPRRVSTLLFSRYDVGMEYGAHTDDAYRSHEALRTDIAVTLFLSDPESYDGGALVVGNDALRPAAGDAVIYPANTVHRVSAVTRGVRLAVVFWVQSLVRDEGQRDILSNLHGIISRVSSNPAISLALWLVHQNLQRMWIEP
jgi:PKHD-type hydroxylase